MVNHTPAPWAFSKNTFWNDVRFYIAQADSAPYTPHYSDVATLIAETASGEQEAIQEANARLIAAAPELLEEAENNLAILKALLTKFEGMVSGQVCGHIHARIAATEATIAKATGETT